MHFLHACAREPRHVARGLARQRSRSPAEPESSPLSLECTGALLRDSRQSVHIGPNWPLRIYKSGKRWENNLVCWLLLGTQLVDGINWFCSWLGERRVLTRSQVPLQEEKCMFPWYRSRGGGRIGMQTMEWCLWNFDVKIWNVGGNWKFQVAMCLESNRLGQFPAILCPAIMFWGPSVWNAVEVGAHRCPTETIRKNFPLNLKLQGPCSSCSTPSRTAAVN